jgi:sugar fermentation stimulation protein A
MLKLNYYITVYRKVNTFSRNFPLAFCGKSAILTTERGIAMEYSHMVPGIFLARPNRFIAHIEIDGTVETVHVKNTGRCRELLPKGAKVWCQHSDNPNRKTQYDLITVEKGQRLINMDSQAPNAAAKEWLLAGGLGEVTNLRAETVWGESRFDFSFEKDGKRCFLEVKGVTLENDGICAFPDAPTQRGAKHLRELKQAVQAGFGGYILFVIQMSDVKYLHPNDVTDPDFGSALREAAASGVQVMAVDCAVTMDSMTIRHSVPVELNGAER